MMNFLTAFEPVILVFHFLTAFILIGVILLQAGKGTDIGSMFGVGGSQSLFGARGAATLLSKLTTGTAIVFLLTSLSLATLSNRGPGGGASVIEPEDQESILPAEPAAEDEVQLEQPKAEEPPAPAPKALEVEDISE